MVDSPNERFGRREFLRVLGSVALAAGFAPDRLWGQEEDSKKVAFVAGVAKYHKDGYSNLEYSESDARELATELQKRGFQVTAVLGKEATLEALQRKLAGFFRQAKKLGKGDVVILAFSGHGQQTEHGGTEQPFFCPYDGLKADPQTLLSLNWVMERVNEDSGSSQNLLLVDACRDNPARGAKGVDGSTVTQLPNKLSVLFSSSAGKPSFEANQIKHGIFTHAVLEGLRGEAANKRGDITWLGLANYVMEQVPEQARALVAREQQPNLLGNLIRQPILARLDHIPAKPAKPGKLAPDIVNSVGMKLKLIPAGEFMMGSTNAVRDALEIEKPQHRVKISSPFYMGMFEVTQKEFRMVTGRSPWQGQEYVKEGDQNAASYISWDDAREFCMILSDRERKTYRLPTEAEWEYACRAGLSTRYHYGEDDARLGEYAWFDLNTKGTGEKYAHPVGQKRPNTFGLYDMLGNVWEWCEDFYDEKAYGKRNGFAIDPKVIGGSDSRVMPGGSWDDYSGFGRSGVRFRGPTMLRYYVGGFRVVREVS